MPSVRMSSVAGSRIVALNDQVVRMRAQGEDILSFTLGEPDFDTPQMIIDDAVEAMNTGCTHYTPSLGFPELRDEVADYYSRNNGIPCARENVVITPAKVALYEGIVSLFDRGEEVLIPDPGWVSYEQMIRLAEAVPVHYPLGERFHPDIDTIAGLITPRTKGLVINSPSNPTGAVFSADEIKALADLAIDNDLKVITDEVYEKMIFEGEHLSIASLPGMADRTMTVFSASKTYAMSGWRVGWAIAPPSWVKEIAKVQQNVVTCATSFVQMGLLSALRKGDESVREMVDVYRKRGDFISKALDDIPGVECYRPEGTFYAFPSYDDEMDSFEFAKFLLEEAKVAVTPGGAFGSQANDRFRLSFASSMEDLERGAERIAKAIGTLD